MTPSDTGLDAAGTAPRSLPIQALFTKVDPRTIGFGIFAAVGSGGFAVPLLGVLALLSLGIAAIAWRRFRYGYDGHLLRVEQGVLQRQLRAIDVGRIQQVELDQPFVHRILGVARIRVETASSGGEAEVTLDGLLMADATALRDALRHRARQLSAVGAAGHDGEDEALDLPPEPPAELLLRVPIRDVAIGAITGSRLLLFPAVIGFLISQAVEFAGVEFDEAIDAALGLGVIIAVIIPIVAIGTAVGSAILQEGDFSLSRRGDDLLISRGLLTRREAVVPTHRVQLVIVEQNWVRRALGMATVEIRSGGSGVGSEAARSLKIPLVRTGELDAVLDALLHGTPPESALVAHPPTARRRARVRWSLRLTFLLLGATIALTIIQTPLWLLALLLGPIAGVALGTVEYGNLAHGASDTVVASRNGAFALRRTYAARDRVQGVVRADNPFQRRLGLTTLTVHLVGAGGAFAVVDTGTEDGAMLSRALAATPIA